MAKQNKTKSSILQWNYKSKKMNKRILNIHKSFKELDAFLQNKGESDKKKS